MKDFGGLTSLIQTTSQYGLLISQMVQWLSHWFPTFSVMSKRAYWSGTRMLWTPMAFGTHYSTYYHESDETAKKRYQEKLQKLGVFVPIVSLGFLYRL